MSGENRIYDYLIVGAGPGGIQMGYYFEKAGRDYLILERSQIVGSFLAKYPRHRKLISINKKHIGTLGDRKDVDNDEVRLRYDWNSLLCDDPEFRFTSYTDDYFPNADLYVKYLDDFVKKYGIKIEFGVEVRKVMKVPEKNGEDIFQLICGSNVYHCKYLIMATGLSKPNIPNEIQGIEHSIGYEEMEMDLEKYRNKHVLIMGHGNSAFEIADWLTPVVGYLNVTGRSPIRFAWKTHYVGDVRAINNNFLDTFQLKSLAIMDEWDDHSINFNSVSGKFNYRDKLEYDYIVRCLGFLFDDQIFDRNTCWIDLDHNGKLPKIKENYESTSVKNLFFIGAAGQNLDYRRSSSAFIHGFRYSCQFLSQYFNKMVNFPIKKIEISSINNLFKDIANEIIRIVNESSAIVQLFDHYCYVILLGEDVSLIDIPVPIDYIKDLKHLVENKKMLVISMEYGFTKDEDVFQPFPIFDIYNGIQSRFLHPVIRYYQNFEIFIERQQKKEYNLCICGHWENEDKLKSETICRDCVNKGYCFCGNVENISYFIEHDRCRLCREGNPKKIEEISQISINKRKPSDGYFAHHIPEDISIAFKRGGQFLKEDLDYLEPLIRFLKSILLDYVIPCTAYYHQQFLISINDYHRELPHQFRFWTFFSYIILRCPTGGNEKIIDSMNRQRYLYFNNHEIRENIIKTFSSMYST